MYSRYLTFGVLTFRFGLLAGIIHSDPHAHSSSGQEEDLEGSEMRGRGDHSGLTSGRKPCGLSEPARRGGSSDDAEPRSGTG